MKKFLVVLLSAMMVFAFATTAFAAGQYSDITDLSKETQDAISKLSALEIIGGYPDGTFKPSATITRAEFAKMACVASGMQESADILVNTASQFSDVKAGEWYTGYINLAVSQGFVKGYPDGTFKPNNTITNAEVITVILRILGYNDNLPGPWPVDYVAKAGALEITSGVVSVSSSNAVRSDVARMIDNALEEDIVMWDKDVEEFVEKYSPTKSLLADSFKGQIIEDYEVKEWSVDSFSKGNLRLTIVDEDGKNQTGFTVTDATVVSGQYPIYDINNMIVDVIYKYDKDLDKNVVKYVDVLSTKIKDTKVALAAGDKVKIGDKTYSAEKDLQLPTTAKNTFYTAYVDEDNIVYKVTVDADNETPSYVVDEYIASTNRIDTYSKAVTLKNNDVMIFDQDGEAIKADDLKNLDIIKVYEDKGDADYVIFVQDWKEATLDGATDGMLSLDGTDYVDIATFFDDGDDADNLDKDYIGTKVKYAVNAANEVIGVQYLETGLGNSIYGVVVSASWDASFTVDEKDYWTAITLFNEEGKTVKYDVESEEIERADSDKDEGDKAKLTAGELVKVRLNKDGEIHRIYTGAKVNADRKAEVDTKNERIDLDKTYAVEKSIVGFDIKMDDNKVDDVAIIDRSDIIAGDVKGTKIQFYVDDNDLVALAVEDFSSKSNSNFGVIKTVDVSNSDITDGIRFYDDNTIYEVTQDVAKYGFYRYELSGDKVTFVNNQYSADTDKAVDLIADLSTLASAKAGLKNDNGVVGTITKVTNGVYRVEGDKTVEFTVEDDTDVLEVTYDAKGKLYTVEKTDSIGKGDVVGVLTRGTEVNAESGLDSFEELEALYVIVLETSGDNTLDENDKPSTGEYNFTNDNSAIKSNDEIKVVDGKIVKSGYITIGKTEYYFTGSTKVTNLANGNPINNHVVGKDKLADKAAWAIKVDGDVVTEIGWK